MSRTTRGCTRTMLLSLCVAGAAAAGGATAAPSAEVWEEMVVTARKRVEPLRDVPTAVTVLRDETLDTMGATRLEDVELRLPNFGTNQSPLTGFSSRYIRGMNAFARNIGFDSGYGVFVDGVYAGRYAAGNRVLQNVERIEFLPGPQGTLFGKNTTLGVLNIVTEVPSQTPAAELALGLGSDGRRGARLGATTGVGEQWALRAELGSTERDGFDRNQFTGRRGNNVEHWDGRLTLAGQLGDTEVRLAGDYFRSTPDLIARQRLEGLGALPPHVASNDLDGRLDDEDYGVSLRLDHPLAFGTLTSISAWREFDTTASMDDDAWEVPAQHLLDWNERQQQFSQELRLAGERERLSYLAGAYYQVQDTAATRNQVSGPIAGSVTGEVESEATALFGTLGYDLTERLTGEVGLRWTHETKDMPEYVQDGGGVLIDFAVEDHRSVNNATASASLRYRLSDSAAAYVRYAEGFKSGGFNLDIVTAPAITPLEFDDEEARTVELGLKAGAMDGRLQLNAAVFHTDYDDLQVSQFATLPGAPLPTLLVTNAASASTTGGELGAELMLERWVLGAQIGYAHGEVDSFPDPLGPGTGDYAGNSLGGPQWTTSSYVQYQQPLGRFGDLSLTAEHLFQDAVGGDLTDDARFVSDSLTLVNLRAQLAFGDARQWLARLWVDNVFDTERVVERMQNPATGMLGLFGFPAEIADSTVGLYNEPRTYGLELRLSL